MRKLSLASLKNCCYVSYSFLLIFLYCCSYCEIGIPLHQSTFLRVAFSKHHCNLKSILLESLSPKYMCLDNVNEKIIISRKSGTIQNSKDLPSRELFSTLLSVAANRRASMDMIFSLAKIRPAVLLIDLLPSISSNEIVDCIWCLGVLYSRLRESPISSFCSTYDSEVFDVQKSHIRIAVTAIQVIHDRVTSGQDKILMSRSAAKLLYGLMKLRLTWRQLESEDELVGITLPNLVLHSVPNMNSQGVSNALYSLGKMQIPLRYSISNQQEQKIKVAQLLVKALLQQLHAVASSKSFKGQVISNSLWGMYSLGLRWSRFPTPVKSTLFSAIARECVRMSPQSVGNTLYALGTYI